MLDSILTILFPVSEEARTVSKIDERELLKAARIRSTDGIISLLPYTEPYVRALIHEAKFHNNGRAFQLLGGMLAALASDTLPAKTECILPMPLASARFRERGYNQVEKILRAAEIEADCIDTKILIRTKNTRPQSTLPKSERQKNVRDAFVVTHKDEVRGRHIVLIDDVVTTGATMHAAKAALLSHAPASVTCIALAH